MISAENAQRIAALYEAAFDRDGEFDRAGVNFWIDAFERLVATGHTESGALREIAGAFLTAPEFTDRFGAVTTLSDRQFVERLYIGGVERPAEPTGLDFWAAALARAEFTRADLLLAFAESGELASAAPYLQGFTEIRPGRWWFDGIAGALPLPLGSARVDVIAEPGEVHFYRIDTPPFATGTRFEIGVAGRLVSGGFDLDLYSLENPALAFFDLDGQPLPSRKWPNSGGRAPGDAGPGRDAFALADGETSGFDGAFVVAVSDPGGGSGSYRIFARQTSLVQRSTTPERAETLALDGEATVETGGYADFLPDWTRLALEAGGVYEIALRPDLLSRDPLTEARLELLVERRDGSLAELRTLTGSTTGADGLVAQVRAPHDLALLVRVAATGADARGDYRLEAHRLAEPGPAEDGPQTYWTAALLDETDTRFFDFAISPADDTDWFAVPVTSARPMRIDLAPDPGFDPVFRVLDAGGRVLDRTNTALAGQRETDVFMPESDGIVFVEVGGVNGTTGGYALELGLA